MLSVLLTGLEPAVSSLREKCNTNYATTAKSPISSYTTTGLLVHSEECRREDRGTYEIALILIGNISALLNPITTYDNIALYQLPGWVHYLNGSIARLELQRGTSSLFRNFLVLLFLVVDQTWDFSSTAYQNSGPLFLTRSWWRYTTHSIITCDYLRMLPFKVWLTDLFFQIKTPTYKKQREGPYW